MNQVTVSPQIEAGWKKILAEEFQNPYFLEIKQFLIRESQAGKIIYPPFPQIFNAFNQCPFDTVKVVILGQDPYHGVGQAHGLCFSVNQGVRVPPSLKNIYKELHTDLGLPISTHGNLESWARQGVLLLNATLTVEAGKANSHSDRGWQHFTEAVIRTISQEKPNVVFLLWGNFARSKKSCIDTQKHCVLEAPHPSPFSVHSGFFGCHHFSKTNAYLVSKNVMPIDWGNL